jgi:2-polyprenyl-6-methoxyphenol hydroxylase-like FAD-dependent oxidoreductase
MACDPLGGSGVARALRSAIEVTEALDATADERALARAFDDYLDLRARYYTTEARFSDAPFWARRRPIAWRDAPLALAPDATLSWSSEPGPHAEALLPPRAIATIRDALASPAAAHVVLARVREVAPIGDRRLLVGLQQLVASGAIRTGA